MSRRTGGVVVVVVVVVVEVSKSSLFRLLAPVNGAMWSCGTAEEDEDIVGAVFNVGDVVGKGGVGFGAATPPLVNAPYTPHRMTPGIATRQHHMIRRRFRFVLNPFGMRLRRELVGVARDGDKGGSSLAASSSISGGGGRDADDDDDDALGRGVIGACCYRGRRALSLLVVCALLSPFTLHVRILV